MLPPYAKKAPFQIGFPPSLLGESAWRLPVIAKAESFFAVWKPRGIAPKAHPWYEGLPDLESAVAQQVDAGKRELVEALGVHWAKVTHGFDREAEGAVLFASQPEAAAAIKNLIGSGGLEFVFHFVSYPTAPGGDEFSCDLPVAAHFNEKRGFVSHRHGKKANTHFRKIKDLGGFALWEATTDYPRMHQIRLHAAEMGIPLLGDQTTSEDQEAFRRMLPSRFYRGSLPFPFLMAEIKGQLGDEPIQVRADWSKSYASFLRSVESDCSRTRRTGQTGRTGRTSPTGRTSR